MSPTYKEHFQTSDLMDLMWWWWRWGGGGYNTADQRRLLRSCVSIIDKQSGYFIMTPN